MSVARATTRGRPPDEKTTVWRSTSTSSRSWRDRVKRASSASLRAFSFATRSSHCASRGALGTCTSPGSHTNPPPCCRRNVPPAHVVELEVLEPAERLGGLREHGQQRDASPRRRTPRRPSPRRPRCPRRRCPRRQAPRARRERPRPARGPTRPPPGARAAASRPREDLRSQPGLLVVLHGRSRRGSDEEVRDEVRSGHALVLGRDRSRLRSGAPRRR